MHGLQKLGYDDLAAAAAACSSEGGLGVSAQEIAPVIPCQLDVEQIVPIRQDGRVFYLAKTKSIPAPPGVIPQGGLQFRDCQRLPDFRAAARGRAARAAARRHFFLIGGNEL